ncbi:hypothetical protein H9657_06000 [Cellulomonas sp. Sa3CUA2]|uniref:Gram-positive cocci surface proteins LPxTG domain-containing protein n=1 Tax=Cellulomonas avistercoris TaxID=2762242 RepID=A0ABR8QBQ6_9CELL|nr:hypothetical protein [Cellulomonas avistercoris]MBD7917830.1 hypothetical protein [Cellulomonas avistercoris]
MTSSRPRARSPLLVALAVIGVAVAAGGAPAAALPPDRLASIQLDDDTPSSPVPDTTPVGTALEAPGAGTTAEPDVTDDAPTDGASPTDATGPAPAAVEVTPTEEPSPTDATSPTPAPSEEPSPTEAPYTPRWPPRIRLWWGPQSGPTEGGTVVEFIMDSYSPESGTMEMCGRLLTPVGPPGLLIGHWVWHFVTPPCAPGEATITFTNRDGTESVTFLYVGAASGAGVDGGPGTTSAATATRLATTGGDGRSALLAAFALLTLGTALIETASRARARAS